jgi:hypothetical protein
MIDGGGDVRSLSPGGGEANGYASLCLKRRLAVV